MDAAAMRESALRGRLITDSRPLHVPDTFLMRDLYPIIEYTSPGDLPADPHGAAPSAPPPPPATSTPSLP
jgi:hypothetical protein